MQGREGWKGRCGTGTDEVGRALWHWHMVYDGVWHTYMVYSVLVHRVRFSLQKAQ